MGSATWATRAGDFNADRGAALFEGEQTLSILERAGLPWLFEGVLRADRITWPAAGSYPDAHFDHAFGSALEGAEVMVPRDFPHCSDHAPVVVVVGLE